jgi:hypothetical protein
MSQKRGTVFGLVDKTITLSDPICHQKNLTESITILQNNGYTLSFIFKIILDRLKHHFHISKNNNKINESENNKFFIIPFIRSISEKFALIVKRHGYKMAYSRASDLKSVNTHKDDLDKLLHGNVVYRISCRDYEASYVGQKKDKNKITGT